MGTAHVGFQFRQMDTAGANARTVSFAGLGFLTLYLCGKLHLYDRRGHRVRLVQAVQGLAQLMVSDSCMARIGSLLGCHDGCRYPHHGQQASVFLHRQSVAL